MSEIQNKAVALAMQSEGGLIAHLSPERSAHVLKSALDLYFALGGDTAAAIALAGQARSRAAPRVDAAVANLMVEIAVVCHLNDIDMVQATYNRLDAELEAPQRQK